MQFDHNSENIKCEFDIKLSKKFEVKIIKSKGLRASNEEKRGEKGCEEKTGDPLKSM